MSYRFDEAADGLGLVPIVVRRALDRAGCQVSTRAWFSLPVAARDQLAVLGAARTVDVEAVRSLAALAEPKAELVQAVTDPPADRVPSSIGAAFGVTRPVSDATWSSLAPLDRYALVDVAQRGAESLLHAAYDEIVGNTAVSTHLAPAGGARMVDVGDKPVTRRRAVCRTEVGMSALAFEKLRSADVAKGDVLGAARIAGIMAAKRTPELIPLCHVVALSKVTVEFELDPTGTTVRIVVVAEAVDRTGVEMEALVAASVAALTIYDMLKSVDRGMVIGPTRLIEKSGGRTGDFTR